MPEVQAAEGIPRAALLDYADADEVYAYALLLCKAYERSAGLCFSQKDTPCVSVLDREGRYWIGHVKGLLMDGRLAVVPDLLGAYEIIHRLCGVGSGTAFGDKVRVNAVKRWLAGDKTLSETQMVLLVAPMAARKTEDARRYTAFYMSRLSAWIDELLAYGAFRDVSDADAYRRLEHILKADLFAYIPGGEAAIRRCKRAWVETYMVADPCGLDSAPLRAYIPFLRTASALGYLSREELELL